MLSIGALTSASGAAKYYIKGGEGQIAGYYADHQQGSKWGGGAKEILGLPDGPVDFKTLEALLDGQVSDTQTLGRMVKGQRLRDPGRDLTFSAPKSVSLAAIGELEKPIIEAFSRSVSSTMTWYEKNLAQAKVWNKDLGKQVKTGHQKILYASFMDFLSRGNDAQLHMHTPVVNLAIGPDNKIRSLNYDLAYKHKILLGSIQRAELAKELGSIGLQIRPAGKNGLWELEGSPQTLLTQFSKRRQEMLRQAPHKINDAKALAHVARITRPAKEKVDRASLRERWSQEFKKHGMSIEGYTKTLLNAPEREKGHLTPKDAIDYGVSHLSEAKEHFDRLDLLKHAMISVYGNVDIKAMEAELEGRVQKGELLISDDGRWLKPEKTHRLEKKLINELEKGHLKSRVLTTKAFENQDSKFKSLTLGQRNAAEAILTGKHRFIGIDGIAGTGKTYLLKRALPRLKERGYEIIGMAPTHKAIGELTKTAVFDQILTVQKFDKNPRGTSKSVLVIDEAGMIGTEKLHAIMHYANSKNIARVVFMGDKDQLPPIEAGRPFEHLQDNGLRTVFMEDVIRQKNSRHVKGVLQLSRQQLRSAFQTFNKEIHEVVDQPLETYAVELHKKMDDPSIIVNTNAERNKINSAIKSDILSRQNIGPGLKQRVWTPFYLSKTEKTRVENYEGASHIRFSRDVGKDFKRGEIYRIVVINHNRAELILKSGETSKAFSPARHGSGDSFTNIYTQSQITLHEGDKIKFRQSDKKLGISNNDFGHIQSLKGGSITIGLEDNKQVNLPAGHRMLGHIDHAWANTTYSFQGVTVDNNIVIMRANNNPLNSLASLYVASSRHKNTLAIVTDDKEKLLEVISEKLEISSETINFKEPVENNQIETDISTEENHQTRDIKSYTFQGQKMEEAKSTEQDRGIEQDQDIEQEEDMEFDGFSL